MQQEADEPEISEVAEWNTYFSQCTTTFIKGRHFCVGKMHKRHNNTVRITLILEKSEELDICGLEAALQK